MSDLIDREDIPYIDLNGDMPQSKVRVWVAFKEQIDALPSADRPTGEWTDNHNGTFTCDQCGCKHSKSNYCPNCGAVMKGGEDE